jgi:spore coat protein U-like protein
MNRTLTLFVASAVLAGGSMAPASAQQANQAVLPVDITVNPNCDVLTQPQTLFITYDTITNQSTQGTSSFTYACTNGAPVAVLITDAASGGSGSGSGSRGQCIQICVIGNQPGDRRTKSDGSGSGGGNDDFAAYRGETPINYWLFNSLTCNAGNQLSPNEIENLGSGTGTAQTYEICGQVDTSNGGQNVPAGRYTDTVTFTFNWDG